MFLDQIKHNLNYVVRRVLGPIEVRALRRDANKNSSRFRLAFIDFMIENEGHTSSVDW